MMQNYQEQAKLYQNQALTGNPADQKMNVEKAKQALANAAAFTT